MSMMLIVKKVIDHLSISKLKEPRWNFRITKLWCSRVRYKTILKIKDYLKLKMMIWWRHKELWMKVFMTKCSWRHLLIGLSLSTILKNTIFMEGISRKFKQHYIMKITKRSFPIVLGIDQLIRKSRKRAQVR